MSNFAPDKSDYIFDNPRQTSSREPYQFQIEAFTAMDKLKARNPTGFSSMLVLPTGAGKTFTAAHWIIKNYLNSGVKVLWIAHRSELLRQAGEAFYENVTKETLPDRDSYRTFLASSEFGRSVKIIEAKPDVVIASRQSVVSWDNLNYYIQWACSDRKKEDRQLLIVFDEAHHAAARSYQTIIKEMKRVVPHLDILGLTATPYRTGKNEQGSLKSIFSTDNGIVYSVDMNTLIKDGFLSNPIPEEIKTGVDMINIFDKKDLRRISASDFSSLGEEKLRKVTQNSRRNRLIVDTYLNNRKRYGKTIVFAIDVVNAIALNAIFKSVGVRSDYVVSGLVQGHGHSAAERNPSVIRAFRNGELDVLVNVNILTEGTDIPDVQTVFLTRPTTSRVLMTQMIGRGLRGPVAHGTKDAYIVSFIDDWRNLVAFESPKSLLEGEDDVRLYLNEGKKSIIEYISAVEVEGYAVSLYESTPPILSNVKELFPYATITVSFMSSEDNDNECERQMDILVFDEARASFEGVQSDILRIFNDTNVDYSEDFIQQQAMDLFFKYAEKQDGKYIGFSTATIIGIIKHYLNNNEMPPIVPLAERVQLYELAESIREKYLCLSDEDAQKEMLTAIWKSDDKIRAWYTLDVFIGKMQVNFKRMEKKEYLAPTTIRAAKEDMDMGELQKHFPAYYEELKTYVYSRAFDKDSGCYISAEPYEGVYFKSPNRGEFEIDHIIPISDGGKTIKENLQLLYWKQNRKEGKKRY